MQVGELFDPWDVFPGAYLPLVLASHKRLSPSSKIVWSMLHHMGRDPAPSQSDLAECCGIPLRTIGNCLAELQSEGFIRPKGKRDRCIIWGFVWHPCFDGTRLRKQPSTVEPSLPILQTCERGSLPILQTTPETTSAESAEEPDEEQYEVEEAPMSAKTAEDSLQNLQRIVCKIGRLRPGYISVQIPDEGEGMNQPPPPGTSVEGIVTQSGAVVGGGSSFSSPTASRGRASPFGRNCFDRIRAVIPAHQVRDDALDRRLGGWITTYGKPLVEKLVDAVEDRASNTTATPIGNFLGWGTGTLSNWQKQEKVDDRDYGL